MKEQKTGMGFADVKIFDFTVYPGKVEGEKAQVPNILDVAGSLRQHPRTHRVRALHPRTRRTGAGRWTRR